MIHSSKMLLAKRRLTKIKGNKRRRINRQFLEWKVGREKLLGKFEMSQEFCCNDLKELLTQISEPIIFKNILHTTNDSNCWKLPDWSLDDFATKCGDSKLPFRVGKNAYTTEPQWEVNTEVEHKTMKEFLKDTRSNLDPLKWYYFDYKYMNKWFNDKPEILESFNWKIFDLNLGGPDSTIWVGSKGAHTNCHQDTYGCNLVAQTHGRKLWLLFSPECTSYMQPTRIPYEESTVYSKYNFFSPSQVEIQAVQNMPGKVKIVTLEPKDVLFIPNGWWHYVESLECSLSVNVWLPLKEDCLSRLKETLVNLVVNTIGDGISRTADQSESSLLECVKLLENSIEECKNYNSNEEPCTKRRKMGLDITNILQSLKMKYSDRVELLTNLSSLNITDFTCKNNIAASNIVQNDQDSSTHEPSQLELLESVVNAFCNPEVLQKVSEIVAQKFVQR